MYMCMDAGVNQNLLLGGDSIVGEALSFGGGGACINLVYTIKE